MANLVIGALKPLKHEKVECNRVAIGQQLGVGWSCRGTPIVEMIQAPKRGRLDASKAGTVSGTATCFCLEP